MINFRQRAARKTYLVFLPVVLLFCCVCPLCGPPYVTERPSESDIVGVYALTDQTLTEERLDILQGNVCEIELRPDGTFAATNFPEWEEVGILRYELDRLVSLEGEWNLQIVGSVGYNWGVESIWGVDFAGAIDSAELVGFGPPYSIHFVFDPDGIDAMIFTKVM